MLQFPHMQKVYKLKEGYYNILNPTSSGCDPETREIHVSMMAMIIGNMLYEDS